MIIATQSRLRTRRGLTTIAVMICLLIITLISGALIKVSLARRALARDHNAGCKLNGWWNQVSTGRSRLAPTPATRAKRGRSPLAISDAKRSRPCRGRQKAADLPAAVLSIAIEPVSGQADRRQIKVRADYTPDTATTNASPDKFPSI